jgi:hypothetical protein
MASPSFHFTSDEVDAQLFSDVQLLNNFDADQTEEFTSVCLAFLRGAADAEDGVTSFAVTHKVKGRVLRGIIKGILSFFARALQRNLTPEQVIEDLQALGLGDEQAAVLRVQWEASYQALSNAMIRHTLKVHELLDMQWKFGVSAASDELQSVGR